MLSENLKAHRKAKGLTQEEFAIRLNIVRQTVSKWETGLSVPDADILIKIADIFEVTVSELLGAKMESDKEIGDIAMQLSIINEQLSVINRRARFIWKAVSAGLAAVLIAGVFIFLLNAADFSPAQQPQPSSPDLAQQPAYPTSSAMPQEPQTHPLDNTANLPADSQSDNNQAMFPSNSLNQTFGIADYANSIDELPDLIYVGMINELIGNDLAGARAYMTKTALIQLMPEKGQTAFINDLKVDRIHLYGGSGRSLGESGRLSWRQSSANQAFFSYLLPAVRDCFGEFTYRTNDNGKTYGNHFDAMLVGTDAALIEAIADDVTIGYIYADDIAGRASIRGYWVEPPHGEGAVEYIDIGLELSGDMYTTPHVETGSIPLYALDGTSVIGEIPVVSGVRFTIHLTVGTSYRFHDFELPGYYYGPDIEQIWENSDEDVFVANPERNSITAVGRGTAILSVTAGVRTDKYLVFVTVRSGI